MVDVRVLEELGGNDHTHMSFVPYSAHKKSTSYWICVVASSPALPALPTGTVQLCPRCALVSPLVALALSPASCWHLCPPCTSVVGLTFLPLFCWGHCSSHTGVYPVVTLLTTSLLYMVLSLCSSLLCVALLLLSLSWLSCVSHLPYSSVPCWLIATPTTFAAVASTVIVIAPIVAVVDVLKEPQVLASSSLTCQSPTCLTSCCHCMLPHCDGALWVPWRAYGRCTLAPTWHWCRARASCHCCLCHLCCWQQGHNCNCHCICCCCLLLLFLPSEEDDDDEASSSSSGGSAAWRSVAGWW